MKRIILSAILISIALPAAAQRIVRPVVEYERREDVDALLRKMNATAFDRHDCEAFPDYPDEFEPYRLRRFSRRSDNWHECLNDHANDMARSARNTSTRLDVMMEDVPDDHPIRPRMARAVKIYNRLAAEALSDIEDAFDDARDETADFIERANRANNDRNDAIHSQQGTAHLTASLACAVEQVAQTRQQARQYNPWTSGYQAPNMLPSSADTERCIARKMPEPPEEYDSFDYDPPTWDDVSTRDVQLRIPSLENDQDG